MRLHRAMLVVPALAAAACAGHAPPSETPAAPAVAAAPEPAVAEPKVAAPVVAEPVVAAPVVAEPAAAAADPGSQVPAFKATVLRPSAGGATEEAFDSRATSKPTFYIVNSTTCPTCNEYAGKMKALETKYTALGVDVVHVYPNRKEPADEKKSWHAEQEFLGGMIVDADASIARSLAADRTPTVYLVSAEGVIVYRGAIDDAAFKKPAEPTVTWAADAIEALLAGRPIAVAKTEPAG